MMMGRGIPSNQSNAPRMSVSRSLSFVALRNERAALRLHRVVLAAA
jgi:hypothetical protein